MQAGSFVLPSATAHRGPLLYYKLIEGWRKFRRPRGPSENARGTSPNIMMFIPTPPRVHAPLHDRCMGACGVTYMMCTYLYIVVYKSADTHTYMLMHSWFMSSFRRFCLLRMSCVFDPLDVLDQLRPHFRGDLQGDRSSFDTVRSLSRTS